MKKAAKYLLPAAAAVIAAVVLLYGRRLSMIYSDRGPLARLSDAEPVKLREQPVPVTRADWDAAGVACYEANGRFLEAEGAFVPFRIWGRKDACRAALACADLIGLEEGSTLRYSYADTYFYDMITPMTLGWHYYAFVQYHGELPVFSGNVIIRAERFGVPADITATLVQNIPADLPTEPQITAEKAERAAAKKLLAEPSKKQKPLLAIAENAEGRPILAWIIAFDDPYGFAVVDALTGTAEAFSEDAEMPPLPD